MWCVRNIGAGGGLYRGELWYRTVNDNGFPILPDNLPLRENNARLSETVLYNADIAARWSSGQGTRLACTTASGTCARPTGAGRWTVSRRDCGVGGPRVAACNDRMGRVMRLGHAVEAAARYSLDT